MSFNYMTVQAPGRRVGLDVQLPFDASRPESYFGRSPANFGDFFVSDSMVRLVDGRFERNLQFPRDPAGDLPARHNDPVDALILRGANYIRNNFDLTGLGRLIESAGVPCVVMGIGAQAARYDDLSLSNGTKKALRILGDHCQIVGTRGEFTADLLQSIGVKNAEPVGCPTLFRALTPDLRIDLDASRVRRVGFNMNRNMRGIYGATRLITNRMQRSILQSIVDSYRVRIFSQGEPSEFIAAHGLKARMKNVTNDLLESGLVDDTDDPLIRHFTRSAVCGSSISDWEQLAAELDVMIGMRFHGNTVAIAQGVPAVYLVNDTRLHELVQYFGLPYYDLRAASSPPTAPDLIEHADFSTFNTNYPGRFERFRWYLTVNGIPTTMPATPVPPNGTHLDDVVLNDRVPGDRTASWALAQMMWMETRMERLDRHVKRLKAAQRGS